MERKNRLLYWFVASHLAFPTYGNELKSRVGRGKGKRPTENRQAARLPTKIRIAKDGCMTQAGFDYLQWLIVFIHTISPKSLKECLERFRQ